MTATKIALVTGGSRGLGKNMVFALAKKGIDVILTYNSKREEAAAVVKELGSSGRKAAAIQLNVGDVTTFKSFWEQIADTLRQTFGTDKIDFLINNAGVGAHASFAETTLEQFGFLSDIHFKGPFFLTQQALPFLKDGGGIVNISSGLARFSTPGYSAYAVMKGAMETLTRYQANELGGRGIRVNIVAPGAIETDFGGGRVRDDKALNEWVASVTALGRVGLPDDIGGVVAFLCTDDARWVNAQRIEASGGMML
jgi:NAD(P)-dependent dehydrogenase (short-subunit alcohol dehydrogenase family)